MILFVPLWIISMFQSYNGYRRSAGEKISTNWSEVRGIPEMENKMAFPEIRNGQNFQCSFLLISLMHRILMSLTLDSTHNPVFMLWPTWKSTQVIRCYKKIRKIKFFETSLCWFFPNSHTKINLTADTFLKRHVLIHSLQIKS